MDNFENEGLPSAILSHKECTSFKINTLLRIFNRKSKYTFITEIQNFIAFVSLVRHVLCFHQGIAKFPVS